MYNDWDDELTLIGTTAPIGQTNSNGFRNPHEEETRVTVFANEMSVTTQEFYLAQQAGYTDLLKFEVHPEEYHREVYAEHQGQRYRIQRAYHNKKRRTIELTLSDLTERRRTNG